MQLFVDFQDSTWNVHALDSDREWLGLSVTELKTLFDEYNVEDVASSEAVRANAMLSATLTDAMQVVGDRIQSFRDAQAANEKYWAEYEKRG
jgi:histidinol dehydrogenase